MRVRSVSLSLPSHGEIEVLFLPPFPFGHFVCLWQKKVKACPFFLS